MSWDDEDYAPSLPASAPALPAKSSWEDEEEDATLKELKAPAPATAADAPRAPEKVKEKHVLKAKQKEREGKGASADGSTLCANCQADITPAADPNAEKKRLEALQVKADMLAAQALVGGTSTKGGLPTDLPTLVAAISLLSGDAFKDLGKLIANRVHEASGSKNNTLAVRFYNELLLTGGEKLGVHELAALSKVLDTIKNKKLAEEKAKTKSTSKAKTVAKIHVGRDDEAYDEEYDDYEVAKPAAAGAAGGAAAGGNSGNVDLSIAAAGLTISGDAAAAGGDDKFTRQRFTAEDDFM